MLTGSLATSPFVAAVAVMRELVTSPVLLTLLAVGFAVSYLLALRTDRRLSDEFSRFWFEAQPAMREGLKRARERPS